MHKPVTVGVVTGVLTFSLWASLVSASANPAQPPPARSTKSTSSTSPTADGTASTAKVDLELQVLVLTSKNASNTHQALVTRLKREGIRIVEVELDSPTRPTLDADFFAESDNDGVHGNYAGIISPISDPLQLSEAERKTLRAYEKTFQVRMVRTDPWGNPWDAAAIPETGIQENAALNHTTANITPAGKQAAFGYLRDSIHFTDAEYGQARLLPLPKGPEYGVLTPLVTTKMAGSDAQAPLILRQEQDGRDHLWIGFDANTEESPTQILFHGVADWLTRGVSTSFSRNYLSVHIDDILLPNAMWNVEDNCEIGTDCDPAVHPPKGPDAKLRMVPEDAQRLINWQKANNDIKIDMVYNGAGAGQYAAANGGRDPLMDFMSQHEHEFRWINHTYSHTYLGCIQNRAGMEWECASEPDGETRWLPRKTVDEELSRNIRFAAKQKFTNYDPHALVTGEHSGLKILPQMPTDNPNLGPALTTNDIRWIASDASTESEPRQIGSAMTVLRHPMDLEYNVAYKEQAAGWYNWSRGAKATGGSGECEAPGSDTPCVTPVDLKTGFSTDLRRHDSQAMFRHMVGNDAKPHFAHQANLAGDHLLYPVMDEALNAYNTTFSESAPLVNPAMAEAGQVMLNHHRWKRDRKHVAAVISDRTVEISNDNDREIQVPVTTPVGAHLVDKHHRGPVFGEEYAGRRSAWVTLKADATQRIDLAEDTGYAKTARWPLAAHELPKLSPAQMGALTNPQAKASASRRANATPMPMATTPTARATSVRSQAPGQKKGA